MGAGGWGSAGRLGPLGELAGAPCFHPHPGHSPPCSLPQFPHMDPCPCCVSLKDFGCFPSSHTFLLGAGVLGLPQPL